MAYTGRCACGAVTLTADGEPVAVRQCWCRHCQKAAAGGPTINAIFPIDAIAIEGELGWFSYRADSGNELSRGFCPACGTQVTGRSSGNPHFRVIRLGVLDAPHGLAPTAAIWTEEAPAWAAIPPELDRFPRQPPPPRPAPAD